jgi:hypothetical protein
MSLQTRNELQCRKNTPEPAPLIPAAQYVRMFHIDANRDWGTISRRSWVKKEIPA